MLLAVSFTNTLIQYVNQTFKIQYIYFRSATVVLAFLIQEQQMKVNIYYFQYSRARYRNIYWISRLHQYFIDFYRKSQASYVHDRNDFSMLRNIFIFNWGCFRMIIVVLRHLLSCKESAGMTIDVLPIMGFYVEMMIKL